jgi:LmbE family N-acetylglucosaminyl deacetylase
MKPLKRIAITLLLLSAWLGSYAVPRSAGDIAEDRGTAGIIAALDKLPVYVRVLQTTAHPDDESAGTFTWLSRKYHATTALFCLTRGEGGQNILGTEKYVALGLVRTGELLEACRYYGTDLFFGNNVDFGFSKTAKETLSKWGHAAALEELVRFIRRWRPTIILSRFKGTPADGHGHHQATGKLTLEAFKAAADPAMFPEHREQGLQPWQAKKLYISSRIGRTADTDAIIVRIPVGDYAPVLGRSYREIASEGYSRHRTQGMGMSFSLPGKDDEYFQLSDSVAGIPEKEDSLFDGIDTSLTAIYDLGGTGKNSIPFLKKDLSDLIQTAYEARKVFKETQPELSAPAVVRGIRILNRSLHRIEMSPLSEPIKAQLKDALEEKLTDFQDAVNKVLGIEIIALSNNTTGVPGQKIGTTVHFFNRSNENVDLERIALSAPGIVTSSDNDPSFGTKSPSSDTTYHFSVETAGDTKITEPFWYLEKSSDARYHTRPTDDNLAPFDKPVFQAQALYQFEGAEIGIRVPVEVNDGDPFKGADFEDFQIVPALSVSLEPDFIIAPVESARTAQLRVVVQNNRDGETKGTVKLLFDRNWTIQPAVDTFTFSRKGEIHTATFTIRIPDGTGPGNYPVKAVATMDGRTYNRRQRTISYPDNWTRSLYDPAQSTLKIFSLKTASGLIVGYVPGAGDDIPAALEQTSVPVQVLSTQDLTYGDLGRFSAIITGIRAYNVNEALQLNNRRLLDYVAAGGTLIVQYVRPAAGEEESPFPYGPYPMTVSAADRITVEESPVRILAPKNQIFNWPNKITDADFDGWVQERGLYFMNSWDERYTPLLSGSDPGEEARNGGMLLAQYGKGCYLYSAYSWFRQLPAGVPGAFRLFANMISIGSEPN